MFTRLKEDLDDGNYTFAKHRRTWERRLKEDIRKMTQIFFPINKSNAHWLLCRAIPDKENPRLEFYDSLPNKRNLFIKKAAHVISTLMNDAFPDISKSSDWKFVLKDCPRQENGYDCGVCVCANIECLARGVEPGYLGKDTTYFRKKIAVEIYQDEILKC